MALIKTIAEAKKYITLANFNADASLPDMDAAAMEHLIPFIGEALYNAVHTAYNADPQDLSALQNVILPKMQRVITLWAYHDNLPFLNAMITDRGITYTQTAEMPPVSRWSYLQLREAIRDGALVSMERLLEYLEAHSDDYADWENSDERKAYNKLLIRSGYEFSAIYSLYQPLRTYITLKGIMGMVEERYIEATIGKDFLVELKADASDDGKEAISLLKRTVAYYTIWHAIQELPVRISDSGFTVLGTNGAPDSQDQGRMADQGSLLSMKLAAAKREGDNYLTVAKNYLDAKASTETFATYFNSGYFTKPAEDVPPAILDNETRKIFRFS
jgi:hypothetical protein